MISVNLLRTVLEVLASVGQDRERVRKLNAAAEFVVRGMNEVIGCHFFPHLLEGLTL